LNTLDLNKPNNRKLQAHHLSIDISKLPDRILQNSINSPTSPNFTKSPIWINMATTSDKSRMSTSSDTTRSMKSAAGVGGSTISIISTGSVRSTDPDTFSIERWLEEVVKCKQCDQMFRRDKCLIVNIKDNKYKSCCINKKMTFTSKDGGSSKRAEIIRNAKCIGSHDVNVQKQLTVTHAANGICHKCYNKHSCTIL